MNIPSDTDARDSLIEADRAERVGDLAGAAARLRAHIALHAEDGACRMRLGRLLLTLGELVAARRVIEPLERSPDSLLTKQANRLLATLDELEGALTSAQIRWERTLADDIDDPEARARLNALRPHDGGHGPSDLSLATLVSPEGVRTSRYRLVRELGRGATAAVYLVHDERLQLPLALKVLHPQLASSTRAEARTKFFAEARLAARLRHPGVVAIYDVDESVRCLAMEYIAGGTLKDRLRAARADADAAPAPAPVPARGAGAGATTVGGSHASAIGAAEVLDTAQSLLRALGYVHRAGVIHGDLKPGNLLLRQPGEVVLADFGVAEFARAQDPTAERPAGTPLYLAPEQFSGAPPSVLTDLFAAGAILWEFLCGRPVRSERTLLMGDHNPIRSIPEERLAPLGRTGPKLGSMVSRLLATDPRDRPATADLALGALDD